MTGEFTVVLDIGHMLEDGPPPVPSGAAMLIELGELTTQEGVSRRRAVNLIARKLQHPPERRLCSD